MPAIAMAYTPTTDCISTFGKRTSKVIDKQSATMDKQSATMDNQSNTMDNQSTTMDNQSTTMDTQSKETAKPKFKASIGGRFLLDGIGYIKKPAEMAHQVNIVDMRLTGKATYGDWFMRIDVGFDNNKVSIKDSFLQWSRNDNTVRAGHMLAGFGIDPGISTYDNIFNAPANINSLLYFGRHMGISYTRTGKHYYAGCAIFMGDNIKTGTDYQQGFSTSMRAVWRPINEEGRILQIGASGIYRDPDHNKKTGLKTITMSGSGVTCLNGPDYQHVTIENARNQFQAAAEMFFSWDKWMIQAEYLASFITRNNASTYFADGAYIMAGYLITGTNFGYDYGEALPTAPASPKSLQLVGRVNFSRLNDSSATINDPSATINDSNKYLAGGNQLDISVGLNYQFNKYICTRLNYSWVKLKNSPLGNQDLHLMQARLAFWF